MTHISTKKSILYGAIVTVFLLLFFESIAHVVEFFRPPYSPYDSVSNLILPPKQQDSFRIFLYGGSTVRGVPIEKLGFVSQLEFWLREIHPEKSLEVYNFGMPACPSSYVRKNLEESITHDPDLLIVLSGHNEFLHRKIDIQPNKILVRFAVTRVLVRIFNRIQAALFSPEKKVTMPFLKGYDRDSNLFKEKIKVYLDNIRIISETARNNNKPLLLLTAPSNVSDWPPVHKKVTTIGYEKKYESWMAEVDRYLSHGFSDRAIESIEKFLHTYHSDPLLLYLLSKAYAVAGDYDHARTLYIKAKDLDPIPVRALTVFNQAIKKLAEMDGVFLVDVENSFQQQALHGLVGFPLVADNCHPTPVGNAIISRDIIAFMRQKGFFVEKDLNSLSIDDLLEHFFSKTTTLDKRRSLEIKYLLHNAKYSMRTPFYNFKASRMYLDKALAMDPSNWEIWVNLATLSFFENHNEKGRLQLRKAIKLRGETIDEISRRNAPYLKEALQQAGVNLKEFR